MRNPQSGERNIITAHAKINLALHVIGQRPDGYHLLDSLVCFTDFGDRLTIKPLADGPDLVKLEIVGPFAAALEAEGLEKSNNNLIIRAASALAEELAKAGITCGNVHIVLEKNIPVASGIGGGSADAAGALTLLFEYWGGDTRVDLHRLAMKLGADVPMCLDSRPKRVRGTGELITQLGLYASIPVLLVNQNIPLFTPEVFTALGCKNNSAITESETIDFECSGSLKNSDEATFIDSIIKTLSGLRNDLQNPAISRMPEIGEVIASIKQQPGCLLVRMSGSGATCFGLFENNKQAADANNAIRETHPDWWSVACNTISADTQ